MGGMTQSKTFKTQNSARPEDLRQKKKEVGAKLLRKALE